MSNGPTDRKHADTCLEKYVTDTIMAIVKGFFGSQFSVSNSNLQVERESSIHEHLTSSQSDVKRRQTLPKLYESVIMLLYAS